jgi:Predicted Zn-dependent peptidases
VEAASIVRKIGQHFNMWKSQPVYHQPLAPPVPNVKMRLCFMEMPALRDATLFMGNSVPFPATDQDYFPFVVLNQILGGTTSSRLFMRLREAKGYAYYAFSETEFYTAGGLYWIRARSKKEDINNVIREVLSELESVTLSGFTPGEIEQAKSYLVGNFPLRIERSEGFADRLAAVVALDLGDAHWKKSIDNVMLISLQKVEDAAVKYLSAPPIIVSAGGPSPQ